MDMLAQTAVVAAIVSALAALAGRFLDQYFEQKRERSKKAEDSREFTDKTFIEERDKYLTALRTDFEKQKLETISYQTKANEQERTIIDLERKLAKVQIQLDIIQAQLLALGIKLPTPSSQASASASA